MIVNNGQAEVSAWGVDQISGGASFEDCAAELATLVWEVNGAYAAVQAAGTCLDYLVQGTWASSEDDYAAWRGEEGVPPSVAEAATAPAPPVDPGSDSDVAAAIVICRSMGDGDATAFGPFRAASFDEAVVAAKVWLLMQPCRPSTRDPFWTSVGELACERLLRGEDGPAGHEIVRLEAP